MCQLLLTTAQVTQRIKEANDEKNVKGVKLLYFVKIQLVFMKNKHFHLKMVIFRR